MSTTLTDLQTRVRERCDIVGSQFVSDAELTRYINGSLGELYDLLIAANENYFLTSSAISVTANTSVYALPSGSYKVIGLDITDSSGDVFTLSNFNFQERNRYANTSLPMDLYHGAPNLRFAVVGNDLWLKPKPSTSYTATLWYIPSVTQLVSGSDTISNQIVDSWSEYVVVDCSQKIKVKAEEDGTPFYYAKRDLKERIAQMAQDRDSQPDYVVDTNEINDNFYFRR